jgi:hypothetical protein
MAPAVAPRVAGKEANGDSPAYSRRLDISDSGFSVAFASFATNLVPGDKNSAIDVFLHIK